MPSALGQAGGWRAYLSLHWLKQVLRPLALGGGWALGWKDRVESLAGLSRG